MQGEKTFKILDYSLNTIYDHKEKSIDKIIKVNKIGEEITCLYAHNWVQKFTNDGKETLKQFCEEECILYAGDIISNTVAAGTVFRSILVWQIGQADVAIVQHRLNGHTGVIFDLKFMRDGLSLMSVSDDRSIRVWKHKEGEYVQTEEFYGHRSRVWAVAETQDMIASVSEDATCKIW